MFHVFNLSSCFCVYCCVFRIAGMSLISPLCFWFDVVFLFLLTFLLCDIVCFFFLFCYVLSFAMIFLELFLCAWFCCQSLILLFCFLFMLCILFTDVFTYLIYLFEHAYNLQLFISHTGVILFFIIYAIFIQASCSTTKMFPNKQRNEHSKKV